MCAGISAATAEQAAIYARDAASAGADGAMILPPLLYRADERELVEFFGSVARATELPLMVYNNPLGSGSDLHPELLARLAASRADASPRSRRPPGTRDGSPSSSNLCPEVDVMVGGDDWALEGLCAGAVGWISGVVDVLPAQSVRLWELCQAGDLPGRARAVRGAAAAGPPGHDAEARAVLQGGARRAGDRGRSVPPAATAADRATSSPVLRRAVEPLLARAAGGVDAGRRGRASAGRVLAARRALRAADHLGARDHPLHPRRAPLPSRAA